MNTYRWPYVSDRSYLVRASRTYFSRIDKLDFEDL